MKPYKPAKLYEAGGDIAKQWLIIYSYTSEAGALVRVRFSDNINNFSTKKERRERAAVIIAGINEALAKGWTPEKAANQATLTGELQKVYEAKAATLKPRTMDSYRSVFQIFTVWLKTAGKGDVYPDKFTVTDARAFLKYLSSVKGVSNTTVNGYHSHLRALFAVLVTDGQLPANPFAGIRRLKQPRNAQFIPFTDDEAARLTAYMKQHAPDMLLFCKLIYYAGIRPNEICSLKVQHLDPERRRIRVGAEFTKNATGAQVTIPAHLMRDLLAFTQGHPADAFLFQKLADGKLGPALAERPVWRNRISERFTAIKRACAIPAEKSLYSWKHYGAIRALEAGASLADIQQQFRHSSIAETEKYLREGLQIKLRTGYADNIPEI